MIYTLTCDVTPRLGLPESRTGRAPPSPRLCCCLRPTCLPPTLLPNTDDALEQIIHVRTAPLDTSGLPP